MGGWQARRVGRLGCVGDGNTNEPRVKWETSHEKALWGSFPQTCLLVGKTYVGPMTKVQLPGHHLRTSKPVFRGDSLITLICSQWGSACCGQANWGITSFKGRPPTNVSLEQSGISSERGITSWSKTFSSLELQRISILDTSDGIWGLIRRYVQAHVQSSGHIPFSLLSPNTEVFFGICCYSPVLGLTPQHGRSQLSLPLTTAQADLPPSLVTILTFLKPAFIQVFFWWKQNGSTNRSKPPPLHTHMRDPPAVDPYCLKN